jgi:prefoldin subunit 5
MVTEIVEFKSVKELMEYVNREFENVRKLMEKYQGELEEAEARASAYERIMKAVGGEAATGLHQEINFFGLKVVIGPTPRDEVEALKQIILKLNEKMSALQKVKRAVELLVQETPVMSIRVLIIDEVPQKLIIKI